MRVALFDYGAGNLHSLAKALQVRGASVRVTDDPEMLLDADAMVLPGVGAFGEAAKRIGAAREAIVAALEGGFPCLGICLGMQLLFADSQESPGRGLGFIAGSVRRLRSRRAPQMGWNSVEIPAAAAGGAALPVDPLFAGLPNPIVYYANTYVAEPAAPAEVIAWTTHEGDRFPAAVRRKAAWGLQFHPEKSADDGLRMIGNWLREAAR